MNLRGKAPLPAATASTDRTGRTPLGGLTTKYSDKRSTGIAQYSNTSVKQAAVQIAMQTRRSLYAYIIADADNTDSIAVGTEGGQVLELNAGDVVPYMDVAPADIWVVAESGTQKVHFQGHGDPGT